MDLDKTFIIAELSANHNHNFDLAVRTIESMAASGADAVKIQTYTADSLALDVDNDYFGKIPDGLWKGISRYDLYKRGSMPYEWQPKLKQIAENLGLVFFSTPFDFEGVDFLEEMDIPMYKIASFEINDIPLIRYIAQKRKPIIFSTGVAGIDDIQLVVDTCYEQGNRDLSMLKCTSSYPALPEDANLQTIPDMKAKFGLSVGVSDHTMGDLVPITAVALGAQIVEKHFILSRALGGPDSSFSMEPEEFKLMVDNIRNVERILGHVKYEVSDKDKLRRRSLYASADIKAGDVFTEKNVRSFRPGFGLQPRFYDMILGTNSKRDITKGNPLLETDLC